MTDEEGGRSLPAADVAEMVRCVRPDWRIEEATLADRGWTSLYHVVADTGEGRRRCVLKASPAGDHPGGIETEARIQAVVAAQTDVPVPAVLGVVDEHDDLRAPFFLMEFRHGETVPMAAVGDLPDATLQRVARQSGRYLGQLHDVDVEFQQYGDDVAHDGRTLRGGLPSGDPSTLVVPDGSDRWPDLLRRWFEEDFERLAESRFADLEPALREEAARRLDALPATVEPVLGRVDHGWFNILVDREAGRLETLIDWGLRFAVPAGYDLAVVEYLLAGGWWIPLPDVPDRRPLVRAALLGGYRQEATVPAALETQRACYHLSDLVRALSLLERRAGGSPRSIPADRLEKAAAGYRALAAAELDRQ